MTSNANTIDRVESTTQKGTNFENRVFDLISALIRQDDLGISNKNSTIYQKKGYFSAKRGNNIIFDISIETFVKDASSYSFLTIIECKNLKRRVSVEDIEEFGNKLNQVGEHNTKGILISTSHFQESALNIAKSEGIGLARVNSNNKLDWIIYRKDKKSHIKSRNDSIMTDELKTDDPFVGIHNGALYDNIADIMISMDIIDSFKDSEDFIDIPYIKEDRIKKIISRLQKYDLYSGCSIDLDRLIPFMEDKYKMSFIVDEMNDDYLGRIEFDPLCIKISNSARIDANRWRFTVAHEIGHLVLHNSLLKNRLTEKRDDEATLILTRGRTRSNSERLEIQANMFASHLLLPENLLLARVSGLFNDHNIHRGHLYLDHQPVNQRQVFHILGVLSRDFGASIETVKLRLGGMGLLTNVSNVSIRDLIRQLGSY